MNASTTSLSQVRTLFDFPPDCFSLVPIYWWVGDQLTKTQLSWHLDMLCAKGIMNFVISYSHTADGSTDTGCPALFSPEWWALFRWVVEQCRKRGMKVGFKDYTIVNRILHIIATEIPDMHGGSLVQDEQRIIGPGIIQLPLRQDATLVAAYAYSVVNGSIMPDSVRHLGCGSNEMTLKWEAPTGDWLVVMAYCQTGPCGGFDPMYPQSGLYAINRLYDIFDANCPGEVGKTITFFFQDELDFFARMPFWSPRIPEQFKKRKGYDLLPVLPALWYDIGSLTPKIRIDYTDVCVKLMEENYFIPIYEWHKQKGTILANDNGGRGQIFTGWSLYGDYFRIMRWYMAPGNDDPDLRRPRAFKGFKVNSSIAHLYQRIGVWNEAFHSSGWGATPAQIIAGLNEDYAYGATICCLHGLYYTTYGSWWEWAPPDFHFRQPYWAHSGPTIQYIRRLSYLLSQGVHCCDIAIVYPITTIEAGINTTMSEEHAFSLGRYLYESGMDFDFIDYESLEQATVDNGQLKVAGERYMVLIIPMMAAIRWSTVEQALQFVRSGGTVIAYGCLPEASERAGYDDIEFATMVNQLFKNEIDKTHDGLSVFIQDGYDKVKSVIEMQISRDFAPTVNNVFCLHRRIGEADIYYIYNHCDQTRQFNARFRAKGRIEQWDPWTGNKKALAPESICSEGTYLCQDARYLTAERRFLRVIADRCQP